MKWKFMAKTVAYLKILFGATDIPLNAEGSATDFTDEQKAKLKAALGDDDAEKVIQALDKEIKDMGQADQSIKAVKDEIAAMLAETNMSKEEIEALAGSDDGDDLLAKVKALADKQKEFKAQIALLMAEPEGDVPLAILNNLPGTGMKHSATHLFASGRQYDAFDKRPWNARLRDGGTKATTFNDQQIPLLKGDLEHFIRQNPTVIDSLFVDTDTLPADWDYATNVQDRISSAAVIAGEIVQGAKKGWAPKNKVKFDVETGQVFRKKVDITYEGWELQQLENTWISTIKDMGGSHPWKMSFVGFLLFEISKQQRVDERIAAVNGIYAVGGDEDAPGASVNSQNGILYYWYYYRDIVKKYRASSIGNLTNENIVDKIEQLIMTVPEDYRKQQGLELQISDRWMRAYRTRAGQIYSLQYNTDQGKKDYDLPHPIDRPNIKFQVLKDMVQTDFLGITFSKNIQVLTYRPEEESALTFTMEKRDLHIFGDYRKGIRFKFVGTKTQAGDPKQFEKQLLWSNDVPVFGPEVKAPIFDKENGILNIVYKNMEVDKAWSTDIASVDGDFVPGQIITITGNASMAGAKNLLDNAVFDLQGNYPLNTGGTITLFVNEDKTFKEINRSTTAPTAASTDVSFTDDTIDADLSTVYRFTGSTTAFDEILNGVEGKTIRIYGKAGVNLTFESDSLKYKIASDCTLDAATDYLQLTKIAGIWTETKRVTA